MLITPNALNLFNFINMTPKSCQLKDPLIFL